MDRDNEIELVQTIQEKDKRIKELEAMSSNIGRELLVRTDELNEVLEKLKDRVPKDIIKTKFKSIINYFKRMGVTDEDISYLKLKEQELLLKEEKE